MELREYLIEEGVPADQVDEAAQLGRGALGALAFEYLLLPGGRLTPADIWATRSDDVDFVRSLWRAMGFANLPDDAAMLTQRDLDALESVGVMLDTSVADRETVLRLARLMGQAMARVADALIVQFRQRITDLEESESVEELLPIATNLLTPILEDLLEYLLRRHLVDAARRQLHLGEQGGIQRVLTVGFADLVRFTEVSQRLDELELARLVEQFEATVNEVVTGVDGQVIKLIGDEAMFTTARPGDAVRAALDLAAAFSGEDVPEVRVGLATGTVLVHQGDVFGPVVNLASRAVGVANPGSVVVDEAVAEAAKAMEGVTVRPIRPRSLKGIGRTNLAVVRRDQRG